MQKSRQKLKSCESGCLVSKPHSWVRMMATTFGLPFDFGAFLRPEDNLFADSKFINLHELMVNLLIRNHVRE